VCGNLHYYTGVREEIVNLPVNAFFVIEGVRIYPLVKATITIGRSLENDLVIDDLRVSRNHAQLRAIKGQFVLFDLSSTRGTFINGNRIIQAILYPHDTISLGGVALTFNQEDPAPRPDLIDTVR
jgi:pSer/pThr/pTyr-binding forkhead associated (FHA) protein